MNTVIWTGPVFETDLKDVAWKVPTQIITVNHDTVGSKDPAAFANYFYSLKSDPLGKLGIGPDTKRIALLTFSAGYAFAGALLTRYWEDPRLVALGAFDSYYLPKGKQVGGYVLPGFDQFAGRASEGDAFALFTASAPPGATFVTVRQALIALLDEHDAKPINAPSSIPVPEYARAVGNLLYLDYGAKFSHDDHRDLLAPKLTNALVAPRLEGAALPIAPVRKRSAWPWVFALAGVGVILYALSRRNR